jgi:hypothetical protein
MCRERDLFGGVTTRCRRMYNDAKQGFSSSICLLEETSTEEMVPPAKRAKLSSPHDDAEHLESSSLASDAGLEEEELSEGESSGSQSDLTDEEEAIRLANDAKHSAKPKSAVTSRNVAFRSLINAQNDVEHFLPKHLAASYMTCSMPHLRLPNSSLLCIDLCAKPRMTKPSSEKRYVWCRLPRMPTKREVTSLISLPDGQLDLRCHFGIGLVSRSSKWKLPAEEPRQSEIYED